VRRRDLATALARRLGERCGSVAGRTSTALRIVFSEPGVRVVTYVDLRDRPQPMRYHQHLYIRDESQPQWIGVSFLRRLGIAGQTGFGCGSSDDVEEVASLVEGVAFDPIQDAVATFGAPHS
jgi:hypothetical protein